MDKWDIILPHRLLINSALKKASEDTKTKIDEYRAEFEERLNKSESEISQAKEDIEKKLKSVKLKLEDELKKDRQEMDQIATEIELYVNTFLERTRLFNVRKLNNKKIELLNEEWRFLSNQMRTLSEEIELLKKRQEELTSLCDISEFVRVSVLSEHEMKVSATDDVKSLLEKITNTINSLDEDDSLEIRALLKLREIIQEKSEYLYSVQYVTWVIQQKIQYSKQLTLERDKTQKAQHEIKNENNSITEEISKKTHELENISKKIRYYWLIPIVYAKADKSYFYKQKSHRFDALNEALAELKDMSERHSDNQSRWQSLQKDVEDARTDIDDIKDSIRKCDQICNEWMEKKTFIFNLCKKFDTPLIAPKQRLDEKNIIIERLKEIQLIREEGLAEAERTYKYMCDSIRDEYDRKIKDVAANIENQRELFIKKTEKIELYKKKVRGAEQELKTVKNKDKRFVLVKLISEDSGVLQAKRYLESVRRSLDSIIKEKDAISSCLEKLEIEKAKLPEEKKIALDGCKKIVLKPTAKELLEESKLKMLQEYNENSKVKKHEN